MHPLRAIFAILIAVSVVLLPTAAGAESPPSKSAEMTEAMADHDCCPPQMPPCGMKKACTSMAACGLQVFSLPAIECAAVLTFAAIATLRPYTSDVLHSLTGGPPLRPPQV